MGLISGVGITALALIVGMMVFVGIRIVVGTVGGVVGSGVTGG